MEDGIVRFFLFCIILGIAVLILVVGEDGLARVANKFNVTFGVMS